MANTPKKKKATWLHRFVSYLRALEGATKLVKLILDIVERWP